jgi:hypothetical protein
MTAWIACDQSSIRVRPADPAMPGSAQTPNLSECYIPNTGHQFRILSVMLHFSQ